METVLLGRHGLNGPFVATLADPVNTIVPVSVADLVTVLVMRLKLELVQTDPAPLGQTGVRGMSAQLNATAETDLDLVSVKVAPTVLGRIVT